MSLRLKEIKLTNFRSYEEFLLEDIDALTILVGPNAVGKTNVVEGIQLVTAIQSFRNPRVEHLIRQGCDFGRVDAFLKNSDRELEISLLANQGKKKYMLNGKARQAGSLKGICPAVVFTPDDLNLAKGSNSGRRDAIDAIGSQVSENHRIVKRDFTTTLKNKNLLLKEEERDDLIAACNEIFIICSAQMTCYRQALFNRILPYFVSAYKTISSSNEEVSFEYVPSWEEFGIVVERNLTRDETREVVRKAIEDVFEQEKMRKRCLVGAHADKINFYLDGRDASVFASQGQQRSLVLAFKIAEVAVIKDILGEQPILLLDDVMSELDELRRNALVNFIEDEMQVFITTTNLNYFEENLKKRARIIELGI